MNKRTATQVAPAQPQPSAARWAPSPKPARLGPWQAPLAVGSTGGHPGGPAPEPQAAQPQPAGLAPLPETAGLSWGQCREMWPVLRAVLLVWALGVWLLLVMMPGFGQVSDALTAMLHLPQVFVGLGLLVAMFAAYSLGSDGHLLWFLVTLLLLAGWV